MRSQLPYPDASQGSSRARALFVGFALAFVAVLALFTPTHARAQSVQAAVEDLRQYDVTFEEGAVTESDLDELDRAASRLQQSDAYFKIVVLSADVEGGTTAAFAEQVLAGLGGRGRVLVYSPSSAAVVSNVDSAEEVRRAEAAVIDEANRTDSFAEGALAGGEVLVGSASVPEEVPEGGSGGESGGGSFFSFWWILIAGGLLVVGYYLIKAFSGGGAKGEAGAALAEGEGKVRASVDRVANLLIELYDRVNLPDAPPEAKEAYQEGSQLFIDSQDELEEADTPPELEEIYPKIRRSEWHLARAQAYLEGAEPPPEPQIEPLFPRPKPAPDTPESPRPRGLPQRSYRQAGSSPWMTQAAMAALAMLMGGGGRGRSYRPPMSDRQFRRFGGRGMGSRPRINLRGRGGGGRGMGRR